MPPYIIFTLAYLTCTLPCLYIALSVPCLTFTLPCITFTMLCLTCTLPYVYHLALPVTYLYLTLPYLTLSYLVPPYLYLTFSNLGWPYITSPYVHGDKSLLPNRTLIWIFLLSNFTALAYPYMSDCHCVHIEIRKALHKWYLTFRVCWLRWLNSPSRRGGRCTQPLGWTPRGRGWNSATPKSGI